MQVNKQELEPDMEQQIGSKLGKEYVKAVYCHPAYLTLTRWTFVGKVIFLLFNMLPKLFFPVVMYGCESWTMKKAES